VLLDGGWRLGQQLEPSLTVFTNPLHMKAMSMVFAGIVVMQIPNVFACRSSTRSAFELGLFSNRFILWGIFFELAFAVMLIYVPFFQNIFNTAALGASEWVSFRQKRKQDQ
jgi:magnesium-transporting ATPase (P-type)